MTRKTLIIANPGTTGNYLPGVLIDVMNYTRFLQSAIGGYWYANEIEALTNPDRASLTMSLTKLKNVDFSIVIFTGHGYFSEAKNDTILELKSDVEIEASRLLTGTGKQLLILDCCRKEEQTAILSKSFQKFAESYQYVNPAACRAIYDRLISNSVGPDTITFACSIGEYSRDDAQRGGLYSYNLIGEAEKWANRSGANPYTNYSALSIVEAHDLATAEVVRLSGRRQNPDILKARTSPYFPFAVIAR